MARNYQLTSLTDDFKALGLASLIESAPEVSSTPSATATPPAAVTPASTPAVSDPPLSEAMRHRLQVRVSGGKARRVRTKKSTSAERMAAKKYRRQNKSKIARRARKSSVMRLAAKRDKIRARLTHEGFDDNVEKLIEQAKKVYIEAQDGSDDLVFDLVEARNTFANLAIISESLSKGFSAFLAEKEDFKLTEFEAVAMNVMAVNCEEISQVCADHAETLAKDRLEEEKQDELVEDFNFCADSVLAAVTAFADLTEEEEDGEEDDEEEEEEEEEEKPTCAKCSGK